MSWIDLEKVILGRSEFLVLLVKFASSKTELETLSKYLVTPETLVLSIELEKPFLARFEILIINIELQKVIFSTAC